MEDTLKQTCPTCRGTGEIATIVSGLFDDWILDTKGFSWKGFKANSGKKFLNSCPTCNSTGEKKLDSPEKLTNNIGCMGKSAIEGFADKVLKACGYSYTMKWTTAGNIVIEPFIYIDKRNINQYPYLTKYWVLHEVAHIDTHPQDDRHGELFHSRLAELMEQFMGRSSYYG